jgi:hypothetical protein
MFHLIHHYLKLFYYFLLYYQNRCYSVLKIIYLYYNFICTTTLFYQNTYFNYTLRLYLLLWYQFIIKFSFFYLISFNLFYFILFHLGADMDELERDLSIEVEKIRERAREQEETLKRQLEDSRERLSKEAEKREFLLEKVQDLESRLKSFSSDVLYESKSFENFDEFSKNHANGEYENVNENENENQNQNQNQNEYGHEYENTRERDNIRENIENYNDDNYDEKYDKNFNENNNNMDNDIYHDKNKRNKKSNNKPNMRYKLSENEDQENEIKWKKGIENQENHENEQLHIISRISSYLEKKSKTEEFENKGDASKTIGNDPQNRAPAFQQISDIVNSIFLNSDLELTFHDQDRILSQSNSNSNSNFNSKSEFKIELKRLANALVTCLNLKLSSIYPTQACEKSLSPPISHFSLEKKKENLRQVR